MAPPLPGRVTDVEVASAASPKDDACMVKPLQEGVHE